jgi:F-type H+-transporting ATPase subunit a
MVIAGVLTIGMLVLGAKPRAIVPGRLQALAELAYENILKMCTDQIGPEGRSYFPFVFTLFFFVLMGNLLGMLPWSSPTPATSPSRWRWPSW